MTCTLFAKEEVLFREGDPADSVFRLLSGSVEILRELDGDRILLGTVGAGQFIGEMGVVENRRRSATARAASAVEVDGSARRHLTVCGTEGTFHIQPLDNPAVRVSLSKDRGDYKRGGQDIKLPKYERYVADAADMAKVIRGEKASDYPPEHDLAVQEALLKACGMKAD